MPRACIAASFTILMGRPKAFLKSNPTQPPPKLCGSLSGRPFTTGPGYPIDTTSYSHDFAAASTAFTIFAGVMVGPESILIGSFCPEASTFTCVPPTSITNTDFPCFFMKTS